MSMHSMAQLFESGLVDSPTTVIDALVRHSIEVSARQVKVEPEAIPMMSPTSSLADTSPPDNSHPLIREMSRFLTRTAVVWAQLTDGLSKGPHIDHVIQEVHQQAQHDSSLADLGTISAVDVDITRLSKSRDLAAQFSRDMLAIWRPDPTSEASPGSLQASYSPYDSKHSAGSRSFSSAGDASDQRALKTRKVLPGTSQQLLPSSPTANASESDDTDDTDYEQFRTIDMNALHQRGKGAYTCPKGKACTKGGVNAATGSLVIFDRNSSFKQHCNKHIKPYKCELAGCPNQPHKRRFARRDGLDRHQASVKHDVKADTEMT